MMSIMVPDRTSYAGCPIVLLHWDPDLYPGRPLDLVQELLIQVLAHGEVLIKDVDLILNAKIRRYLSNRLNFQKFASLVETGRVKVLTPDAKTSLDLDPELHPLLATARARDNKRPLKSKPWTLSDDTARFCKRVDAVFGRKGRTRPRVSPPEENQFATTLSSILSGPDTLWRTRPQFGGINDRMADQFVTFCHNPGAALALLAANGVTPNATNGFYRSLAYQCADRFPRHRARAMKNLVQSVYAYCELNRENAAGTYCGERVAENTSDSPLGAQAP